MSLANVYVSLVKYHGLNTNTAMAVHNLLMGARDITGSFCIGFMPLSSPSLPAPDDTRAVGRARRYVREVTQYLKVLERCSRLYESLLKLGMEAWDSFYIYHLADIASTRFSGAVPSGVGFDRRLLDTIALDLKEVELTIYNTMARARWTLGPLLAAYEHSPTYKVIVDTLKSRGYMIEAILDVVSAVEVPRLSDKLLKWVKSEGYILQVILRPLVKRKATWRALRAKTELEAVRDKMLRRLERTLGPRLLSRLTEILTSERASITKNIVLCSIAKEAADCSGLYPYLLATPKPLSYIKSLWRPPKCPYPGFTWPLERILRDHIVSDAIGYQLANAMRPIVKTVSGDKVEVPDDVINKYALIVAEVVSNLLKPTR